MTRNKILDKSATQSILIVTVTETTTLTDPDYILELTSLQTQKVNSFTLSTNYSEYTNRYDKFIIPSGQYYSLTTGEYDYKIYETNGTVSNVCEIGKMKVVGTSSINYVDVNIIPDIEYIIVDPFTL